MKINNLIAVFILLNAFGCWNSHASETGSDLKNTTTSNDTFDVRKLPNQLTINGVNIFNSNGSFLSGISKYTLVNIFEEQTNFFTDAFFQEGELLNTNDIIWEPFRSAKLSEYHFIGKWKLNNNGTLNICGKYEPKTQGIKIPYESKEINFTVNGASISKVDPYFSYKYRIKLWITKNP